MQIYKMTWLNSTTWGGMYEKDFQDGFGFVFGVSAFVFVAVFFLAPAFLGVAFWVFFVVVVLTVVFFALVPPDEDLPIVFFFVLVVFFEDFVDFDITNSLRTGQ